MLSARGSQLSGGRRGPEDSRRCSAGSVGNQVRLYLPSAVFSPARHHNYNRSFFYRCTQKCSSILTRVPKEGRFIRFSSKGKKGNETRDFPFKWVSSDENPLDLERWAVFETRDPDTWLTTLHDDVEAPLALSGWWESLGRVSSPLSLHCSTTPQQFHPAPDVTLNPTVLPYPDYSNHLNCSTNSYCSTLPPVLHPAPIVSSYPYFCISHSLFYRTRLFDLAPLFNPAPLYYPAHLFHLVPIVSPLPHRWVPSHCSILFPLFQLTSTVQSLPTGPIHFHKAMQNCPLIQPRSIDTSIFLLLYDFKFKPWVPFHEF